MEEEDHGNFVLTPVRRLVDIQVPQIESSPNRFQLLVEENQVQSNNNGVSSQEVEMNFSERTSTSQEQDLGKGDRQGGDGGSQQKEAATPSEQTVSEEPLTQSIAGMIRDLAVEVRGSFETSNSNKKEIRGLCEALRLKFDDLAERTAALELEVSELKRGMENNAEAIQQMKVGEKKVLLKLKLMENNMRRNYLRFLKVPEGLEGGDLKSLVVCIIKQYRLRMKKKTWQRTFKECTETRSENPPNRDKPRKILVYFHTYTIKERILVSALKKTPLTAEGVNFEIRSDLSSVMLNKQWELGKRIDVLKRLGATGQLKFPASLRVMANKMYTFSDVREIDGLIKTMDKEYQLSG
ncbi:hypothetical protein NDU88_003193 [Pleurodeles waltl]|uniref:Uncharacterized protein n=1 Tax=Pleurodeles waltl TaxID=8319 RepID=A0AAV7VEP4_PLEWA|nr:hypothetical protein NDU88_003193 [Pleurodeles waltl]